MENNVKWTKEQELAITYRGGAAIVSAAAGSGKTAVLVERVKRLILDEEHPVNADEMVISTFTNKAAEEMKARLDRAIEDELAKAPDNRRLTEQRLRLNDASICTISSFCLNLLRRHSALADMQPGLNVLDESEAKLMFSQSLSAVLEGFCETGDPDERDRLYDRFAGEDDKKLEEALTYLYNFSRNIPDAGRYFAEQLEMYRDPGKSSASAADALAAYFRRRISEPLSELAELCDELDTLCEGTPAEHLPTEWRALSELITGANAENIAAVCENGLEDAELPKLPRKTKTFDNTAIKEVNDAMKELWGGIVRAAGLLSRRNGNMTACAPVLETLVKLVKRLDEDFSARKRDKGCVDFSDIELLTLRMLRGENGQPSAAAREIAKGIKVIIVDEFQDSNEVQYEIFRLLSDSKRNLYFVGDIKQSIYRFRGADPLVFARLTKDPDFTVIELNRNFRSCKEVIDSVNGIFTGTMTEELGDVEYNEHCALVQGASYETDEKNRTELITFSGKNAEQCRISEASYIADRIKRMVSEGFTVGTGDKKRPCGYGDFAVLMGRYSANAALYKAAFEKAGIPFDAKEDGGYTDFTEIKRVLALLRVIDDPYRDSDLAAVLMGEPYMFTANELAEIKIAGGVKNKKLWSGFVQYAKRNAHAAQVLEEINGYREYAGENSAERLIRKIFDDSMLLPAAEASPDGAKRGANLRMLLHYARSFTGGESASVYDFIKFTENLDREKIMLPQAKGESGAGSAVKIMTIHGSKGLEFPVCFVANLTSQAKRRTDGGLICDPRCGVGMKISDIEKLLNIDTQPYDMAAEENARLEASEEMRLLYVAATRAKEKLIFTVPKTSRTTEDMHYGWVLGSKAVRDGLITVTNIDDYKPAPPVEKDEAEGEMPELPPFTEYAHKKLSEVPAKVTATQVGVLSVDEFSEYGSRIDRFLRTPSFLGEKGTAKLSGKKRGDAYHKAMEVLDFTAAPSEVSAMLDRMQISGRLTKLERVSIDDEDIRRFLKSDLCHRAAVSGDISR
ncbi:MAG: UvrD-helicase domain-containing protein, partial [Ruminiclostridium sp.]|nr:UvrD-helicase domain-containing protein [Ruminiclostridium sp.]